MRKLLRRIEILEKSLCRNRTSLRDRIQRKALQRLSEEELGLLEAIASERENGAPGRELSEQESVALQASIVALELEVQMAGFDSVAEFEHAEMP